MNPRRSALVLGLALALPALLATGCAGTRNAPDAPDARGAEVRGLGVPYRTVVGDVYFIRVQDEYRLIRCIPTGPIAGYYDDVFRMERGMLTDDAASKLGVRWNEWVPVPQVPGLEVAFLAPDRIAFREKAVAAPGQ